jgi:hypothetical protein
MLDVIKPVAAEATKTMKDFQQSAQNLNRLTDENSESNLALTQFKTFGEHLSGLTEPDGALSHSLTNIEKISTSLTENDNIEVTMRNLRSSSEKLKVATTELQPAGENIKQFSETIKTQPWRLIWPSTKSTPKHHQLPLLVREPSPCAKARGRNRVEARLLPHARAAGSPNFQAQRPPPATRLLRRPGLGLLECRVAVLSKMIHGKLCRSFSL